MKLNLDAKTKEQELIKAYLEENASETLAEKVNKGTPFEKGRKDFYQPQNAGRLYEVCIGRGKETCLQRRKFSLRGR